MGKLHEMLKSKRKELKLSLREAGNLIGISHSYLSTLEKGFDPRTGSPISPTPETLKLISKAYNIKYEELMKVAGYLKEYSHVTEETFNDEDFKRILPFIIDYLNKNIMKHDDKKDEKITDALDISKAWEYLDDNEKARLFNSVFKEVKYNKETGKINTTNYIDIEAEDIGSKTFESMKKNYLNHIERSTNKKNTSIDEKYKEVYDIEEAMEVILSQPGLMLNGELLSDESKIILANSILNGIRTVKEIESKKNKQNQKSDNNEQ